MIYHGSTLVKINASVLINKIEFKRIQNNNITTINICSNNNNVLHFIIIIIITSSILVNISNSFYFIV
jgi:hypothetical protein